ncbi:uncharacterized protein KNAG_0F02740 [Huiozyma naganishii CBS 8797]|uniref:Uncharacterized protein n=1 Tax=Huiozyma naganishii (strain ATCC MYA-139 / BCRC 22969 / CBS 8797 / KCTC 17520 / NBRC 10181 / NCYC 3082 / Yp74L-3) TaxID=1071383 RepID=J7S8I4_HUIN7|nr:hypothetical protein KNAG_0F02740 [Kazachstania naganishii CBS 8797]CCK70936.1 hypothetical protein KNAG_0F02740 [Kazachstania naganishii CBS 8797]
MSTLLYDIPSNPTPRCMDQGTVRITVMGDERSGKTSLVLRCITDSYHEVATGAYMEDIYHKPVNLNTLAKDIGYEGQGLNNRIPRNMMDVYMLDCSAFEIADFSDIRNEQIIQSDAFIICFDPTDRATFSNLRTYQRRIERVRGIDDAVPIFVVATKVDLQADMKIQREEIHEMLNRFELSYDDDYFEVSSKLNLDVKQLLWQTLMKIEDYRRDQRSHLESEKLTPNTLSALMDKNATASLSATPNSTKSCMQEKVESDDINPKLHNNDDEKRELLGTDRVSARTLQCRKVSSSASQHRKSTRHTNMTKPDSTCCIVC